MASHAAGVAHVCMFHLDSILCRTYYCWSIFLSQEARRDVGSSSEKLTTLTEDVAYLINSVNGHRVRHIN